MENGHNWKGYAHMRMLEIADKLLREMDFEAAKRLVDSGVVRA